MKDALDCNIVRDMLPLISNGTMMPIVKCTPCMEILGEQKQPQKLRYMKINKKIKLKYMSLCHLFSSPATNFP